MWNCHCPSSKTSTGFTPTHVKLHTQVHAGCFSITNSVHGCRSSPWDANLCNTSEQIQKSLSRNDEFDIDRDEMADVILKLQSWQSVTLCVVCFPLAAVNPLLSVVICSKAHFHDHSQLHLLQKTQESTVTSLPSYNFASLRNTLIGFLSRGTLVPASLCKLLCNL